jgi:peptide methionine sulfoxide reductase MsrB
MTQEATELPKTGGYVQFCDEETMAPKAHGTSAKPVQKQLRWGCDRKFADRICNFNRHSAEYPGYWQAETRYLREVSREEPTVYYDSVTGLPLFVAPIGRSMDEFLAESESHFWPSFRDSEVVWENMRVLKSTGEAVSSTGTHLGHLLPDSKGNRYCISIRACTAQTRCVAMLRVLTSLFTPCSRA